MHLFLQIGYSHVHDQGTITALHDDGTARSKNGKVERSELSLYQFENSNAFEKH